MTENAVDVVFVGSCTNGRISDIEEAAGILKGRKVADGVRMLVVPGSEQVKAEAEARGLDKIITGAGAEWREAGCSMCIGMNGDIGSTGPTQRQHQQPKLRGSTGRRGTYRACQPGYRGGIRHRWIRCRSEELLMNAVTH